jgi:hypothetical protein
MLTGPRANTQMRVDPLLSQLGLCLGNEGGEFAFAPVEAFLALAE